MKLYGLGRHLHNQITAAGFCHSGKISVKLVGLRRSVPGRLRHSAKIHAVGPDHTHLFSGCLQNSADHVGSCSLSLGPCHTDGDHPGRRMPEPGSRKEGQGPPSVLHLDNRGIFRKFHRMLRHKYPHAGLINLAAEIMGIHIGSLHAYKYGSGLRLPGIINHFLHIRLRISLKEVVIHSFQPLFYLHWTNLLF